MNARIATWTILVLGAQALIGCEGSSTPYNPVTPSPPAPPITAPTPSPPSLAVDLRGNYALTFEVGRACKQVPKELRIRTYEARIEYASSRGSTDLFVASLSGATFHNQLPVWIEVTHRASGSTVWLDLALSDNVIVEEPEPGTYFMVAGADGVASIDSTEPSTISASFTGYFAFCAGIQNQCSFDVMVHNMCQSQNSRWTLTR